MCWLAMEECISATVHGVFVGAVYTVKISQNAKFYFEAKFSDGKNSTSGFFWG